MIAQALPRITPLPTAFECKNVVLLKTLKITQCLVSVIFRAIVYSELHSLPWGQMHVDCMCVFKCVFI